jgi:hypothetical protein
MAILGTIGLIALVILGIMVLRVKSDPLEKESIRQTLADAKRTSSNPSPDASQDANSTTPPQGH